MIISRRALCRGFVASFDVENPQLLAFPLSSANHDENGWFVCCWWLKKLRFLERALSSNKGQPDLLVQKSRLCLEEGNPKEAMQVAMKAVEIGEEHNPKALFYVIRSYIELNNLAEAKSQMEFLKATHKNIEEYPVVFLDLV
uniref:Tetratricopeptide repeat protein 21A/21B second ARM domain-containing protein n=1 Tax=Ditylenchus dipsaci TaxID=166011 RepID=A0A915CUD1_9BILA